MRMIEEDGMPGVVDTLYLCNFRVTVDGEWLCLKELVEADPSAVTFPPTPSPSDPPPHMFIARDPFLIERRNLVNISKLIVKELIETSLKFGRMLDSDHMPLQHFFIVLEHVLRHGLRPKKGLLGPKKELWDILQVVEKLNPEAQDITTSVRELPTVKTAMGRARAWLRLALMQKKLADYLKLLIDHRDDILCEYFEPDALLMSDEAIIIVGLLVGLNVIDCNLCVKEEDLDCQQGVIDFSLYLRSSHHNSIGESPEDDPDMDNMTTVLDQKNYIEELNRHLNATVGNLQAKVESLTTTNTLLKEDLAIARKHIATLTGNPNYKIDRKKDSNSERKDEGGGEETDILRKELENEKKSKAEIETELKLQISLKAEMEVAMKLLEKDIQDKQETIVSLRRQLEDIKRINLEMYRKLQDCESSLKQKTELVSKLEAKTASMSDSLQTLGDKHRETEKAVVTASETTAELKVEREWRQSLQTVEVSTKEKLVQCKQDLSQCQQELSQYKGIAVRYADLQEEHYKLKEDCRVQEETLEEMGRVLSQCKLQVEELKSKQESGSVSSEDPVLGGSYLGRSSSGWVKDSQTHACTSCKRPFNITRRKHHCRNCGEIFCNTCSDNEYPVPPSSKPVRVCDQCHLSLLSRYSVLS